MTSLLFIFSVALFLSLSLTPIIRSLALHYNIVRSPSERCTHIEAKPRIGGIALYLAFFITLGFSTALQTDITTLLHDIRFLAIFCGASLLFLTGLIDDIFKLKPAIKLSCQVIASLITWYGGVQINALSISLTSGIELGWLSMPITIFWIVLVTNAINLIDGLDGLAAGVSFFASIVMLVICITTGKYIVSIGFAALAGSILGFLRYNFNPASIFMGDCGSYFLGYTIAALSILGSVKGQTTLAMLIPFLALGVPLLDALLSPLRRFARGKKMFLPDNQHIHHKLIELGITHRKAVLILYSATVLLGIIAFLLTLVRDEQAALILLIPGAGLFFTFRKLGYLNYFAIDKLYGWLQDITETSKISNDSRSFLDLLLQIRSTHSFEEMWQHSTEAFKKIELDRATLTISPSVQNHNFHLHLFNWENVDSNFSQEKKSIIDNSNYKFKIEMPLIQRITPNHKEPCAEMIFLGTIFLEKDIETSMIKQFALRRIEQLKQEINNKVIELNKISTIMN